MILEITWIRIFCSTTPLPRSDRILLLVDMVLFVRWFWTTLSLQLICAINSWKFKLWKIDKNFIISRSHGWLDGVVGLWRRTDPSKPSPPPMAWGMRISTFPHPNPRRGRRKGKKPWPKADGMIPAHVKQKLRDWPGQRQSKPHWKASRRVQNLRRPRAGPPERAWKKL